MLCRESPAAKDYDDFNRLLGRGHEIKMYEPCRCVGECELKTAIKDGRAKGSQITGTTFSVPEEAR
jgi:hypothetical protein